MEQEEEMGEGHGRDDHRGHAGHALEGGGVVETQPIIEAAQGVPLRGRGIVETLMNINIPPPGGNGGGGGGASESIRRTPCR